jgi:hypothetical protein
VAEDRESRDGAGLRRGLSVPCFAEDPADLVELGVSAERAGLLPGYRDAGVTWWVESPGSGPDWLDAVRERLREPTGRGPEVQSDRG